MINEGIPVFEKDMGDLFFVVMLVRRGKDHPDLPAANYTFKSYYFDSIEKYRKLKDEMFKCCEMFGLRAYVSVNVKSKEEFSKMCAFKFAQNILNNEYKLVDIDNINLSSRIDREYVEQIEDIINSCDSKYSPVVIYRIPTRSGFHLLTRPFNMQKYRQKWDELESEREFPDIKKNHITLLYENI